MPAASAVAAELVTSGSLTVCMALMGAPAVSLDDSGNLVGYNIGFANELAKRLNLKAVIQQQNFDELMGMVESHGCDISISSQNITADREGHANLIPYTQSKQGRPVVVAKGNPHSIGALSDLCGLPVSAATGTTSADEVNGTGDFTGHGINSSCQSAGSEPVDLHTYDTELDAVQALLDGTVVAYLGNSNFVTSYPQLLENSSATLPPARQGIAVALDHPQLTTAIESALGAMIADGTYLSILGQYLPSQSVDNFSIIE
jgi:polar amino acid transport system substrate-binding protein